MAALVQRKATTRNTKTDDVAKAFATPKAEERIFGGVENRKPTTTFAW
jgi:hypothetical protein